MPPRTAPKISYTSEVGAARIWRWHQAGGLPSRRGRAAALCLVLLAEAPARGDATTDPSATVVPADAATILAAVRAPGACAVLVNVWATWCDPCREEMPELIRIYRKHHAAGLRLVLVSADEEAERDRAARFLASLDVHLPTWLKRGSDMEFIAALAPTWSGALPASFLFLGDGRRLLRSWFGKFDAQELERAVARLVSAESGCVQRSETRGKSRDAPQPRRRKP